MPYFRFPPKLGGFNAAAPGPIGGTTPDSIAGTTGTFSGAVTAATFNGVSIGIDGGGIALDVSGVAVRLNADMFIDGSVDIYNGLITNGTFSTGQNFYTGGTFNIASDFATTGTKSVTLAFGDTGSITHTFPATSATLARTDAAQTFTGTQTFSSAPVLPNGTNTVPSFGFAADATSGLWYGGAAGRIGFIAGGTNKMNLTSSGYTFSSDVALNFNSTTNIGGYNDTTLRRGGIGLFNLCAGTASSDSTATANAKLGHGCSIFTPTTVANLPASPAAGWVAAVNNALAPAVGVAVVGGGAAFALVCHNGTSWIVLSI